VLHGQASHERILSGRQGRGRGLGEDKGRVSKQGDHGTRKRFRLGALAMASLLPFAQDLTDHLLDLLGPKGLPR
jgi:hypothetical protein